MSYSTERNARVNAGRVVRLINELRAHEHLGPAPVFILPEVNMDPVILVLEEEITRSELQAVHFLHERTSHRLGIITHKGIKPIIADEVKALVRQHNAIRPWRLIFGYDVDTRVGKEAWHRLVRETHNMQWILTPKTREMTLNGNGKPDDVAMALFMFVVGCYRFVKHCVLYQQRYNFLPMSWDFLVACNPPITKAIMHGPMANLL